ncbi:hypothetical protein Q4493_10220 [Colwellia sp. 1_MG-2023]|uniref:hypothetical protein n=1 Tax=Colwellia sp. 1_MG-2023 TaxID=3062649 RepID=UPI0026E437D0|nr:hypothetical protein [Colwellia sp. 1_MG-2023]MDO6446150.1 hypothetical protein [Colwellia sp. 1_MG-2023]
MNILRSAALFSLLLLNACGSSSSEKVSPDAIAPAVPTPTTEPKRVEASYDYLNANSDKIFSTKAFLPNNAVKASNIFEGRLTITGTPKFKQKYGSVEDLPKGYEQWPEFSYAFVQDKERLIPIDRSHGFIGNGAWSITAGVGAVWDEADDNGYSRASFPYTIKENNQNCEANGLATFLFKSDGSISNVHVQNVAETCLFYGFEFYGTLTAEYDNYSIENKGQVITDRNIEEAARIPSKPLAELASDYPGVDLANYAYAMDEADLNGYSILVNNISYSKGCNTRHGEHPYCADKTIGIYSFTKTIHGFMVVAALEKQYPGFKHSLIQDLVPECSDSRWHGVTIENALDMATGNYQSSAFESDENSHEKLNGYFLESTRVARANFACNAWPQQVSPGTLSVYHTSDTELVGYAASAYVKNRLGNDKEAFNDILVPLYQKIGLSHYIQGTQRTSDSQDAWAGYGLSATLNDVVRIAQYIRDEGVTDGLLDPTMVNEVLTGEVKGLFANIDFLHYDNSFWRLHVGSLTSMSACGALTQVPMLSGFGGHTSLIMPKVIITQMTDSGALGVSRTVTDVFNNISNVCP